MRFRIKDYSEVRSQPGDFLYLDPPYQTDLRFYDGQIDFGKFFDWLGQQGGSYVLSLNGKGKGLREVDVPEGLYDECVRLARLPHPPPIFRTFSGGVWRTGAMNSPGLV